LPNNALKKARPTTLPLPLGRPFADSAAQGLQDGLHILEALAASGLRSLRYVKEVDNVAWCMANDLSAHAVKTIERNRDHNKIAPEQLRTSKADAKFLMYKYVRSYEWFGPVAHSKGGVLRLLDEMPDINKPSPNGPIDVIDLDPYGGASAFMDGAVQTVRDGGMLMVTCTDSAVICGNHGDVRFPAYAASSSTS